MPALELRAANLAADNLLPGICLSASLELKPAYLADHNILPGICLDASPRVESC